MIGLCLKSLYEMGESNTKKTMKFLYLAHNGFYISSMICCILYLNNHFIYCFTENYSSISDISWIIAIISFVFHWNIISFVLFFRLYYIFQTTIYEISKSFICLFFTLFIIGGVSSLLPTIYFDYIYENQIYSLSAGGLLLFFVVLFQLILSFQFVIKLFQVISSSNGNDDNEDNDDNDDNDNHENSDSLNTESKIVTLIRKYTILAFITSIGSLLVLISFIICIAIGKIDNFFDNILMVVYIFNVLINTICVSLSLSLYDILYKKYCNWLDNNCKICCYNLAKNYRGLNISNSVKWSVLQSEQLSSSDEQEQHALVDL